MIKKEELRFGNYFIDAVGAYCIPNTIQQVKSIDRDGVNKWSDMGASGCCPFDKMNPIPITPELLEEYGFEKEGSAFSDTLVIQIEGVLHLRWDIGLKYLSSGYKNGILDLQRFRHVKYLHQLQNLFYDFTESNLVLKSAGTLLSGT